MSGAWEGGKGDKPRIGNVSRYSENFEKIFRKNKPDGYCLFLDDYRNPKDAYLYDDEKSLHQASNVPNWGWVIVRSYDQFVSYIEEHGCPKIVSFDNDLSNEHMNYFIDICASSYKEYNPNKFPNTGIQCARFLKNYCNTKNIKIPLYFVHSANHLARPIINKILNE